MSSQNFKDLESIIKVIIELHQEEIKKLNGLSFESTNEINILQDILLRKNIKESAIQQFIGVLNNICKANIGLAHEFQDLAQEFKFSPVS